MEQLWFLIFLINSKYVFIFTNLILFIFKAFEVKAHDSCVNKLNWNPKATNLFISGS